jgi:acyl dehydratase
VTMSDSASKTDKKTPLYFEDFEIGQTLETESFTIDKKCAIAFAREYDPQDFHIDEAAAKSSAFHELIVSGWQTAAVTMKLKAGTILARIDGGLLGLGVDSLRWPRPVFPGDTLNVVITITGKRASDSKPTHGIMKYKMETFNQNGELVLVADTAVWAPRRP